jgi:DNA-binding MarR family transcriptional regulator
MAMPSHPPDRSGRAEASASPDALDDLLTTSHWRPVWQLLNEMDETIAGLYAEAGITGLKTRFVGPLIQLGRLGTATITQLAAGAEVTHSAMSQTVAAMRREGLVERVDGPGARPDARTRTMQLTARGRELLPFLQAEWVATETTVRELDAEIPYALVDVVRDLRAALARRPFRDRLIEHLRTAQAGRQGGPGPEGTA